MNADVPAELLAGALAARVAHDLAGAVGGVTLALGLLDEKSPGLRDEAANLIGAAVGELEARLRFCRAAYGLPPDEVAAGEIEQLAQRLFAGGRAQLTTLIEGGPLPGVVGQAILGLAQLAAGALGAGGEAQLRAHVDDHWVCALEARGPRIRFPAESEGALRGEGPPPGATGRWAPPAFMHALVVRRGGDIRIEAGEQRLIITATVSAYD